MDSKHVQRITNLSEYLQRITHLLEHYQQITYLSLSLPNIKTYSIFLVMRGASVDYQKFHRHYHFFGDSQNTTFSYSNVGDSSLPP